MWNLPFPFPPIVISQWAINLLGLTWLGHWTLWTHIEGRQYIEPLAENPNHETMRKIYPPSIFRGTRRQLLNYLVIFHKVHSALCTFRPELKGAKLAVSSCHFLNILSMIPEGWPRPVDSRMCSTNHIRRYCSQSSILLLLEYFFDHQHE